MTPLSRLARHPIATAPESDCGILARAAEVAVYQRDDVAVFLAEMTGLVADMPLDVAEALLRLSAKHQRACDALAGLEGEAAGRR